MEKTTSLPVISEARQRTLLNMRRDMKLVPRGWMTTIADTVGVSRQLVNLVLNDPQTFTKYRSNHAVAIWDNLAELHALPEHTERINLIKGITDRLQTGQIVTIKANSLLARFIERRIRDLGLKVSVSKERTTPAITYTYKPKVAKAA